MNWKIFSFCILSSFPIAGFSQVQDTLHLTIEQLFDKGMSCNLQLQADKLKERICQEQKSSAEFALYPDIELGMNGGIIGQPIVFEKGLSQPTLPQTPDWSQNYSISLTQPIYYGGKIRLGIKKNKIARQIAALTTSTDRSDLKLNLLGMYLDLFCAYKQQDILKRNILESERRLKDIRRMKEEGVITNNDVLRSELRLIDDSLSLTRIVNQIRLISQRLNILLNINEASIIEPDSTVLCKEIPELNSYEAYVLQAYTNNPRIQSSHKRIEQSENSLKIAQTEYLPQISLVAGNTLERPISRTMVDKFCNCWNIGLSLSIPISLLYKNKSHVKEAEYGVLLTMNEEDRQKQQIQIQLKTAYLKHEEAIKKADMMQLAIRQSQENYRIMQNRYMNQLVILTDLLDANSLYLNTQLEYIAARTQVIFTYYELQNICGNL